MESKALRYTIYAALIGAVATIIASSLGYIPALTRWWYEEDVDVHIIVLSTPDDQEAIKKTKSLREYGYLESKVYATPNQQFAVSIGMFKKPKAQLVKKEIVDRGLARSDSYLLYPKSLVRIIYPIKDEDISPVTLCYLVAYVIDDEKEAIKYKNHLISINCRPSPTVVTIDAKYAVILGKHKCEDAEKLMEKLVGDGTLYDDAYVTEEL